MQRFKMIINKFGFDDGCWKNVNFHQIRKIENFELILNSLAVIM